MAPATRLPGKEELPPKCGGEGNRNLRTKKKNETSGPGCV